MHSTSALSIGIYEKALPDDLLWPERLIMARKAGFDYLEMSIDESDWRLERLEWGIKQRAELRSVIMDTGVPITSMCLSAQRRYPLGSLSADTRERSFDILKRAIEFAVDVGVRIILVPAYDVFYEESDDSTKMMFFEGLKQANEWASTACVMLALENTEHYQTSIRETVGYVEKLESLWFQLYADVGNLVASGHEVLQELELGTGHVAGVHIKDATLGKYRDVPFGEGDVPFLDVFRKLREIKFHGPFTVEMWTNEELDPQKNIAQAYQWVAACIKKSFEEE